MMTVNKITFNNQNFFLEVKANENAKKVGIKLFQGSHSSFSENAIYKVVIRDSFFWYLFGKNFTLEKRVEKVVNKAIKFAERKAKQKTKYQDIIDTYKTMEILSKD